MAGNYVSIESMDRMIQSLITFSEVLQEVVGTLKKDYDAVGAEWNDVQYDYLAEHLNELYAEIYRIYPMVSEMTTRVQLSKRLLIDYLTHR